jgi:hypothetical protein
LLGPDAVSTKKMTIAAGTINARPTMERMDIVVIGT